jgi:small subunit ribosomal protein S8
MSNTQITNFASAISNAQKISKYSFLWPYTKSILEIAKIFKTEGYVSHYLLCRVKGKNLIEVVLKHDTSYRTKTNFKIISKVSFEKKLSKNNLWAFSKKAGTFILSSPFGVVSDREARLLCTGGKVLLFVC